MRLKLFLEPPSEGIRDMAELMFRAGMGLFFLFAGVGHALGFDNTVSGATILSSDHVISKVLAMGAVVTLLVGGASLVCGWFTRVGAMCLALFLVPATMLHAVVMEMAANTASILVVSADESAQQSIETLRNMAMQGHQANIMKNIVLLLAVLYVVCVGAGRISMDEKRRIQSRKSFLES